MIAIEALRDEFRARMETVCTCGHARQWHLDVSRIDPAGIGSGACIHTHSDENGRTVAFCKCPAFVEKAGTP